MVTRSVPPADGDDEAGVVEQPICRAIQKPEAVVHQGRLPTTALHESAGASLACTVESICMSTWRPKTRPGRHARPWPLRISCPHEGGSDQTTSDPKASLRRRRRRGDLPRSCRISPHIPRDNRQSQDAGPVQNDTVVRGLITRSSAQETIWHALRSSIGKVYTNSPRMRGCGTSRGDG
jgi:hypothetical protein